MARAIYVKASCRYHAIRDATDDELTKVAIRETFYVDDYIGGAITEEQAIRMRHSLTDTKNKACLF